MDKMPLDSLCAEDSKELFEHEMTQILCALKDECNRTERIAPGCETVEETLTIAVIDTDRIAVDAASVASKERKMPKMLDGKNIKLTGIQEDDAVITSVGMQKEKKMPKMLDGQNMKLTAIPKEEVVLADKNRFSVDKEKRTVTFSAYPHPSVSVNASLPGKVSDNWGTVCVSDEWMEEQKKDVSERIAAFETKEEPIAGGKKWSAIAVGKLPVSYQSAAAELQPMKPVAAEKINVPSENLKISGVPDDIKAEAPEAPMVPSYQWKRNDLPYHVQADKVEKIKVDVPVAAALPEKEMAVKDWSVQQIPEALLDKMPKSVLLPVISSQTPTLTAVDFEEPSAVSILDQVALLQEDLMQPAARSEKMDELMNMEIQMPDISFAVTDILQNVRAELNQ